MSAANLPRLVGSRHGVNRVQLMISPIMNGRARMSGRHLLARYITRTSRSRSRGPTFVALKCGSHVGACQATPAMLDSCPSRTGVLSGSHDPTTSRSPTWQADSAADRSRAKRRWCLSPPDDRVTRLAHDVHQPMRRPTRLRSGCRAVLGNATQSRETCQPPEARQFRPHLQLSRITFPSLRRFPSCDGSGAGSPQRFTPRPRVDFLDPSADHRFAFATRRGAALR